MASTASTSTADPVATDDGVSTLCEAFQATAARCGDAVALRTPGDEVTISWRDYAERVRELAAGLAAHGIGPGDTVAMMLTNRPETHIVDVAALHLGATPLSIYNTSSPKQLEYLFTDAAVTLVVTERAFVDTVLAVRERLPDLKHVFVVDEPVDGTEGLDALAAAGEADFDFEAAWRAVTAEDIATLIYTSGTTGHPKGVEVTHDNLVWTGKTWAEVTKQPQDGRLVTYLPMAHLADRVCAHYMAMLTGASITCVADAKKVVPAVGQLRPTLWLGVPRIWEKLKTALEDQFAAEPDEAKRQAVADALEASRKRVRLQEAGEPVPKELQTACEQADAQIFSKVRDKLGFDPEAFLLSGAAALSMPVLEFFAAIGAPINEGYGMSETSAVVTMNREGARRLGTVGLPLPGCEAKLADDGELLVRGRLVMKGYRNLPEKTAETKDADGWLSTGDIAEIDADGFVKIVDRKKELIINAAGKNMSPANIEAAIKDESPLIGAVMAVGDGKPYNTALVVLDADYAPTWAKEQGIDAAELAELAGRDEVQAEIAAAIERGNESLSRVEQIKKHTLLDHAWTPGGEEMTPTMKLKRKPITDRYADVIDAMYS